jgi:hypothetical protein
MQDYAQEKGKYLELHSLCRGNRPIAPPLLDCHPRTFSTGQECHSLDLSAPASKLNDCNLGDEFRME